MIHAISHLANWNIPVLVPQHSPKWGSDREIWYKESHTREGDMATDTPRDVSLEQQKLVRTLLKALDAIGARLRRVPLDDEKQACRELTDILHAVRAIANAV